MINVILKGGLGNILFQYAVGKHLAIKNNTTIRLIINEYVNRYDIIGRKTIKQLSFFRIGPILYAAMIHEKIRRRLGIHLRISISLIAVSLTYRHQGRIQSLIFS